MFLKEENENYVELLFCRVVSGAVLAVKCFFYCVLETSVDFAFQWSFYAECLKMFPGPHVGGWHSCYLRELRGVNQRPV